MCCLLTIPTFYRKMLFYICVYVRCVRTWRLQVRKRPQQQFPRRLVSILGPYRFEWNVNERHWDDKINKRVFLLRYNRSVAFRGKKSIWYCCLNLNYPTYHHVVEYSNVILPSCWNDCWYKIVETQFKDSQFSCLFWFQKDL